MHILTRAYPMQVLTGDMLLAAAFVSYAGPFTSKFRAQLIREWIKFLTDKGAPMTAGITDPLKVSLYTITLANQGRCLCCTVYTALSMLTEQFVLSTPHRLLCPDCAYVASTLATNCTQPAAFCITCHCHICPKMLLDSRTTHSSPCYTSLWSAS